jgi:hypothetical protein
MMRRAAGRSNRRRRASTTLNDQVPTFMVPRRMNSADLHPPWRANDLNTLPLLA